MGRKSYSRNPIIEELKELPINFLKSSIEEYFENQNYYNQDPWFSVPEDKGLQYYPTDNTDTISVKGTVFTNGRLDTEIEREPCHMGNYRYYFLCRYSGFRVTSLYQASSGEFLSRFALNAVYRIQKEHNGRFYYLNRAGDLYKRSIKYKNKGKLRKSRILFEKSKSIREKYLKNTIDSFQKMIENLEVTTNF